MNSTEHILHIAKLKNNCPECYTTNGLEISFAQKELENRFYSQNQKDVIETIYCYNCNNIIYPVSWNDDIEKIYEYHKKQASQRGSRLRLKPLTYAILIGLAIAILLIFYLVILI